MHKYTYYEIVAEIEAIYGLEVIPSLAESLPFLGRTYPLTFLQVLASRSSSSPGTDQPPNKEAVLIFLDSYGLPKLDCDPYEVLKGVGTPGTIPLAIYEADQVPYPTLRQPLYKFKAHALNQEQFDIILLEIKSSGKSLLAVHKNPYYGAQLYQAVYPAMIHEVSICH